MSDYKPTEHDGLKKDGTPDKRVGPGAYEGKQEQAVENPKDDYSPTSETSNSSQGSAKGEFAHGKVDPVEAGRKGGHAS